MKRIFSTLIVVMMLICCTSMIAFGASDGNSLDDIINGNTTQTTESQNEESNKAEKEKEERHAKEKNFIAGLNDAADLSTEVEGVSEVTSGIRLVAAWLVQVLSYAITVLLALRVVLDLAYIGIPFSRTFLSNGHVGNAQAGAGGMPNSSMGGGMGGMGMGGMGMGGMGMNRGMGMGGMGSMGGMGGGMGMNRGMGQGEQGGGASYRIQWVSNAALNAVAGESSVSPDGRAVSPFKLYCKDMVVVLVLVPVLLTLAVTGTLTNLGFLIGNLVVDAIAGIGDMI